MYDVDLSDEPAQADGLVVRGLHEPDALLLALYGELDVASANVLERKLMMAEASGTNRLVLDLSGLDFLDGAGLETLLRAQRRWMRRGRDFALLRGPRPVQRVFELTNATGFFSFED